MPRFCIFALMKRFVLIGLCFVAVLFMACDPYPRESERMEAALQRADSVYGEGENDTTLFIPGLAEASSYFAEKKQYEKAALAALYNGYFEKDYDKSEAMRSFKEAEYYGEIAHDSLTTARAQFQMGRLLFNDYMYKEALACFQKAEIGFKKHYSERSMAQNSMACCYIMTKDYENAAISLDHSLMYAELGYSNDARTKALNNYAVLFEMQGEYGKALEYLRMVKPLNDEQLLLNHLNLGIAFVAMNEMDSVDCYYENLEKLLDLSKVKGETCVKLETKCAAYEDLFNLAEQQGDWEKAVGFRKEYEKLLFQLFNNNNQKNNYRIQQKYDYESLQNALNRKIANRQRIIALLCVMVSLILTALGGAMLRLSRIRKSECDLKASLMRFTEQNRALSGQSENYKTALEDAQKELSKAKAKEQRVMQKLAVYLDNPGDKSLLLALKNTAWGNEGFWTEAFRLFDEQHPKLRERLTLQYPNLSDQEQKIMVLSGLNASREDTALLLQTSVHMVDKLRNSVKKKISSLIV